MKRYVAALMSVGLLGLACISTAAPRAFAIRYALTVYECGTSCAEPGVMAISSAALGDTVWVKNAIELTGAADSFTPQQATLRPDCAENVVVVTVPANTAVRSLPTPAACPDSTYRQNFQLAGIDYPNTIERYFPWIVDSDLVVGTYGVRGRVLVQPRIEPTFLFELH